MDNIFDNLFTITDKSQIKKLEMEVKSLELCLQLSQQSNQKRKDAVEIMLRKLEQQDALIKRLNTVLKNQDAAMVKLQNTIRIQQERIAHITRALKLIAKRKKVALMINSQADKNTSKKTGPELGSIMYTQSIGQDSDNVLALFRDEIMINDREMGVKVLKQPEGVLGKVIINWNFDKMNFKSIYSESESAPQDFSDSDDSEDTNNKTFSI